MAVREIPAAFEIRCDGCGKTVQSTSKHRPDHWSNLDIGRDAYDFQGCAVADGSVHLLLCDVCSPVVFHAVNEAHAALSKSGEKP